MIDIDFIERLLKAFDDSGADSLEIERGGTRVSLAKTPPAVAASVAVAAAPVAAAPVAAVAPVPTPDDTQGEPGAAGSALPPSDLLEITSPMVGTFYLAPSPDAPAYVDIGTRVSPGDTLCIIEAMKLMNELESEVDGTIRKICVENGQPVEFGQVLFRADPS